MSQLTLTFFLALFTSHPRLLPTPITPKQYPSHHVSVICDGSPSRIRMVRRISFGMTTRPRSSIRLTIPVAFNRYYLQIWQSFRTEETGGTPCRPDETRTGVRIGKRLTVGSIRNIFIAMLCFPMGKTGSNLCRLSFFILMPCGFASRAL